MKQSQRQNEMDILLRGMAKQASSVSETGNGKQQSSAAHLDADELSAFAEHTLPPATQARYTAHLVDCSQCRKLIAQLSAAAGLPIAEAKSEAPKTSFWERLPAFLSPAVLRFAVPALGMLAVITVGIFTFRQQQNRSAEYVAQNEQQAAQSQPSVLQEVPEAHDRIQPPVNISPTPGSTIAPGSKPAKAGEETGTADKVTTADTSAGVASKDAPKPSKADASEAQPAFAPEPAPPAVAKQQAPASAAETKSEAVAKDKAAAPGVAVPQSRDARTAAQAVAEDREASVSRKAATAGRGGAGLNRVESRRNETEQAKRADQTDSVTEVAGRRFRKQGNTWIDTAYDSGRPAITIVRGSEQYRALTADEPGIRTIAERLAGEVLVVWKGRAYRIR